MSFREHITREADCLANWKPVSINSAERLLPANPTRFAESKPLYDGMVKDMVKVVFDEVPRVPMFQPLMDVAMQPNISGYTYWFHLQPDYRQIVKK